MSGLKISGMGSGSTAVSNAFIDYYMNSAGSTNLKAYLVLLRMLGSAAKITVADMADRLDCSESDVVRALKHWEKKGLMRLEYDEAGGLAGLEIFNPELVYQQSKRGSRQEAGSQETGSQKKALPEAGGMATKTMLKQGTVISEPVLSEPGLPEKKVDLNALSEDDAYRAFMYVAESYIGHPLTSTDCETFGWLYSGLHMDLSLLEYLVEYCVNNGHNSVRYMEKVALDWHQKKVDTVEKAKIYTPLNAKNMYAIMKALGLGNRQLAASERSYIDGWLNQLDFSMDMILEACNKTIITIQKPSFSYVDSILQNWKKAGFRSLEDVKQNDEAYRQGKGTGNGNSGNGNSGNGNAGAGAQAGNGAGGAYRKPNGGNRQQTSKKPGAMFHDFEQRQYDYDELLKKLSQ